MLKKLGAASLLTILASYAAWLYAPFPATVEWSQKEIELLQSLSLTALPELAPDPSNAVADSAEAAQLGHRLFFEEQLSGDASVACATCHQPDNYFTDGLALAEGTETGQRHTPSLVGLSYSPWFYWDGRKDSQWSQALSPLEAAHEHNIDRLRLVRYVLSDPKLRALYEQVFGAAPALEQPAASASPLGTKKQRDAWKNLPPAVRDGVNTVFANLGKSLAAYQRKLQPGRSRFDDYIDSLSDAGAIEGAELSAEESAGLRLFIGKADCVNCHNGPLLTNNEFHNTGVLPVADQLPPMGRYDGIRLARKDPFNCSGDYSDATPDQCLELRFALDDNSLVGAHKTPTLRNVAKTAPYMHGGQLLTLRQVINHYNEAPVSMLSHNEAKPLKLRPIERRQLEALMHTLSAPLATDPHWLQAP